MGRSGSMFLQKEMYRWPWKHGRITLPLSPLQQFPPGKVRNCFSIFLIAIFCSQLQTNQDNKQLTRFVPTLKSQTKNDSLIIFQSIQNPCEITNSGAGCWGSLLKGSVDLYWKSVALVNPCESQHLTHQPTIFPSHLRSTQISFTCNLHKFTTPPPRHLPMAVNLLGRQKKRQIHLDLATGLTGFHPQLKKITQESVTCQDWEWTQVFPSTEFEVGSSLVLSGGFDPTGMNSCKCPPEIVPIRPGELDEASVCRNCGSEDGS